MRLRILGFICPQCGDKAWRQTGRCIEVSWWDGYVHQCYCAYGCQARYLMLFEHTGRFVMIIEDDDEPNMAAGRKFGPYEFVVDHIAF